MKKWRVLLVTFMLAFVAACGNKEAVEFSDSFEAAAESAEGSTVNLYMWGGDEGINSYIDDYVAPRLEESYDVELNRVAMDTAEFVRQLSLDKKADRQLPARPHHCRKHKSPLTRNRGERASSPIHFELALIIACVSAYCKHFFTSGVAKFTFVPSKRVK